VGWRSRQTYPGTLLMELERKEEDMKELVEGDLALIYKIEGRETTIKINLGDLLACSKDEFLNRRISYWVKKYNEGYYLLVDPGYDGETTIKEYFELLFGAFKSTVKKRDGLIGKWKDIRWE